MGFGRIEDIDSLSPGFVQGIVKESGRPDNFVDSAEGSFVGFPDLETDPDSQELLQNLDTRIAELGKAALQVPDK